MKKMFVLFALLAIVLTVSPVTVHAQEKKQGPPTLAYYDAQINVLLPRLIGFQEGYHNATGKHYQALKSHSQAPTVPIEPDRMSGKPTDQAEDLAYFWDNEAHLPKKLDWAFAINTYSGPDGDGYVLVVTAALIRDETWTRSVNVGPEEWRSTEWIQVVPFEFPR